MVIDDNKLIEGLKERNIDDLKTQMLAEEAKATNTALFDLIQEKHILPDEEFGKMVAGIIGYPYGVRLKRETDALGYLSARYDVLNCRVDVDKDGSKHDNR